MGSILSGAYDKDDCNCYHKPQYTSEEKRRYKLKNLKNDLKRAKQDVKYLEKEIKKLQKEK